jgi:hypothetical protein
MAHGNGAPLRLSRSSGTSKPLNCVDSSRSIPSACAANASWTSHTPISSGAIPAAVMTLVIAHAGAMPIRPGSNACTAEPTILANGATPSPATTSSLAMTTALDPSDNGVELPAVICVVPGGAGSLANESSVVSSRIVSSCSKNRSALRRVAGMATGTISFARGLVLRAGAACG